MYLVIAEDQAAFDTLYNDHALNLKGRIINALSDSVLNNNTIKQQRNDEGFNFQTPDFAKLVGRRPAYIEVCK